MRLVATVLVALTAAASAATADAAFPGADGRIVFGYGDGNGYTNHTTLFTVRPDGTGLRRIFRGRWVPCTNPAPQPAVSPDGRRVVFMWSNRLAVISINGGRPRRITPGLPREFASDPTWSPDGRSIAYIHTRPNREEQLWVVRSDGSHRHVLLKLPYTLPPIRWSPAGGAIMIQAGFGGFALFSPRTHRLRKFGKDDWGLRYFDFSPDGRQVAMDCTCFPQNPSATVALIPASGSGTPDIRLMNDSANELYPVWSPSGTQLLIHADDSSKNVRIIGLDGAVTRVLPITDKATYDWQALP